MAPRLSIAVGAAIDRDIVASGRILNPRQISMLIANYKCSERTIYRHIDRIRVGRPQAVRTGGQHRVITPEIDTAIHHLLNEYPWFYQDEISEFLYEVYDIDVSQPTIFLALARIKHIRKKLKIEAAQRNNELRTVWQDALQYFSADQLLFVDESGSDERTGDRQYGWSNIGIRAKASRWFGRRDRISVLPAYTIEGYVAGMTFPGTCNATIFEEFIIDHVLPICNPYPRPRSVIVMDNASIHHTFQERLETACRSKGVWIRFLPPYSPDFNPIEESFNDLKAFIRRHYRRKIGQFPSYQAFLEWAIIQCGTGPAAATRARAHFRNAGIHQVPDE
jgi:transposase